MWIITWRCKCFFTLCITFNTKLGRYLLLWASFKCPSVHTQYPTNTLKDCGSLSLTNTIKVQSHRCVFESVVWDFLVLLYWKSTFCSSVLVFGLRRCFSFLYAGFSVSSVSFKAHRLKGVTEWKSANLSNSVWSRGEDLWSLNAEFCVSQRQHSRAAGW